MGRRQAEPTTTSSNHGPALTPSKTPSRGIKLLDRFLNLSNTHTTKGAKAPRGSASVGNGSNHRPPSRRAVSSRSITGAKKLEQAQPILPSTNGTIYRHAVQRNNQTLYEWQQTKKTVNITYPTVSIPKATHLFCNISEDSVQLGGRSGGFHCSWFLSHATGGPVDAENSHWKREQDHCTIYLAKAVQGKVWNCALIDDRVDNVKTTMRCRDVLERSKSERNRSTPSSFSKRQQCNEANDYGNNIADKDKVALSGRSRKLNRSKSEQLKSATRAQNSPKVVSAKSPSATGRRKSRSQNANNKKSYEEKTAESSISSQEGREKELRRLEEKTANNATANAPEVNWDSKRRSSSKTNPNRSKPMQRCRSTRTTSDTKPTTSEPSPRVRLRKANSTSIPTAPPAEKQKQFKRNGSMPNVMEPPKFIFVELEPEGKPLSDIRLDPHLLPKDG
eukprot:scaffold6148_cov127-Cylindrotheca_fusiformis.AAC.8